MTTEQANQIIALLESIDKRLTRWDEPIDDITEMRWAISRLATNVGGNIDLNSAGDYVMAGALGQIHRLLEPLSDALVDPDSSRRETYGRTSLHSPLATITDQLSQIGVDISIGLRGNEWHPSGLSVAAEAAVDSLEASIIASLGRRMDDLRDELSEANQLLADIANKRPR